MTMQNFRIHEKQQTFFSSEMNIYFFGGKKKII